MGYVLEQIDRRLALAVVFCAVLLGAGTNAAAEDATSGAPGDWFSSYTGARTIGLGGAFVATADEPLGAVWNPAGLSYMFQNQVHYENAQLFEDTSLNALSFAMPGNRLPSFGFSYISLGSGSLERTNELNEPLGTFTEGDNAFLLSASKAMSPRFALGANFKIVNQSIEEFGATGIGIDFGALYDVTPTVRVGASLLNIGGPSLALRESDEKFPTEFRVGTAVQILSGRGMVSAELDQRAGWGTDFHLGTEVWVHPAMALRVGYNDQSAAGGLGFRFARGAQIDYGISDHELGLTNRIGLSYRFGGFHARSEAEPRVFSPLGQQAVTKIHLQSKTKAEASQWQLEIVDGSNRVVRKFGGNGEPPQHVMWDGKDESGLPLADGVYNYQLVVRDADGRTIEAPRSEVEIYTGGPQGSVPAVVE